MSILLQSIVFFKTSTDINVADSASSVITDSEKLNINLSVGTKGSGLQLTLKNAYKEHVNKDGEFKWSNADTVKIYLKYTDDPSATIDTDSTDDLIIIAEIEEYEANLDENLTTWTLKCVDKTYRLLNKLWAKAYTKTDVHDVYGVSKTGWTPPELIKEVIDINTINANGVNSISANFKSKGGFIEDTRPDGSLFDNDTLRSELSVAKVFKPVYEWIDDLSSTSRTNTIAESDGTLVCPRPYIFYIDERNRAHWESPNTVATDYLMTVGNDGAIGTFDTTDPITGAAVTVTDNVSHVIYGHKLKRAIFDVVNMIIFNAGNDLNGNGILFYFYDSTTKTPTLKPTYKPMTDIATRWKTDEFDRGLATAPVDYTLNNNTGTLIRDNRKYDATYNFKPKWADGTEDSNVTSDTSLNDSLRDKCIADGQDRAEGITTNVANPRWKGTITLKGYNYKMGREIIFNNELHGIINAKVRITTAQHTVNKDGWFVTLTVEEDATIKEN